MVSWHYSHSTFVFRTLCSLPNHFLFAVRSKRLKSVLHDIQSGNNDKDSAESADLSDVDMDNDAAEPKPKKQKK